ncbi:MAG: hypothetical protein KME07_07590 [Pegethrix bostrychoides GSE-TBD4-15B]|jgi:hypothetical protein|uniref:Mobilization protein MobC n=1 Tax=Pegethrix bostrychoides GSE-TBD4-15B TaxID=2839662 RepID=A0A951P9S6_9CYAN|nr:hypothetical protein [Pegethrix bostrychoides GSE-TBD4-15B]
MPSTLRRSPNATLVTQPAIDEAAEALYDLPEKTKEKMSLREAVDVLRDQITAALDKGYSYEDIAAMLAKQGISIAPSSLKHYLARSNRQLKQATGTQTRRRRSPAKSLDTEADTEVDTEELSDLAEIAEPEPAAPKRRGRPPASDSASAAAKTRSTAARAKTVPTATGTRKRRSKA